MRHDGAGYSDATGKRTILHSGNLYAGYLDLIVRQPDARAPIFAAFGIGVAFRFALLGATRRFDCAQCFCASDQFNRVADGPWDLGDQAGDSGATGGSEDRNEQAADHVMTTIADPASAMEAVGRLAQNMGEHNLPDAI